MGYETRLIIGVTCEESDEFEYHKNLRLESDRQSAHRPILLKDGKPISTGRTETYFSIYATIDLSKCGIYSSIGKIDRVNPNKDDYIYFYNGDTKIKTDAYGDYMKAIPIIDVINALRKDIRKDDYRRFKWVLALLESMQSDSESIEVLMYGH